VGPEDRRLGAVVWGYDVRPAVKEQVQSLGAKFLEFELGEKDTEDKGGYAKQLSPETQARQQQWLADQIKTFDVASARSNAKKTGTGLVGIIIGLLTCS